MTFAAMAVPIGLVAGLFLALLLHLVRDKAAIGLRTVFFIPGALTGPVLVMIFAIAFDPKLSPYGLLMKPFGWHASGRYHYTQYGHHSICPSAVVLDGGWEYRHFLWRTWKGITPEVIEAAMIDGCDGIRMARFIKLPMLQAWVINYIINSLVFNMQIYTEPALLNAAMEGMAPVNAYWSLNQLGAQILLYSGNFGLAAPISLLQVTIGFVAAYFLVTKTGFYQTESVQ